MTLSAALVMVLATAGALPSAQQPAPVDAEVIVRLATPKSAYALVRLRPDFDRSRICVVVPWDQIAARYWDRQLEQAALAHMAIKAPPRVPWEAVRVLGMRGSADVKQPLIDRFVQWENEWHGRASELETAVISLQSPALLENGLVSALLTNPNFTLTPSDIARIRASCVTDRCRADVDRRAR